MNFYALSALINGITSSALGFLVYFKNRRGIVNRYYGLTTVSIGIWSYGYFFWQISTQEAQALFWCRALMVGAIFIPPTYLHFVLSLLGRHREKIKVLILNYILGSIFFILNFTPLFIKSVSPKLFFTYWPDAGIAFFPFLLLTYFNCIAYAILMMFKEYKKETGIKRTQIKYVLIGALLGFGGGATNYPLWYNIPIPPVGNILVSAGIGIMAYAIVRYRLMDITVTVTRTGVFILLYTLVLGIPFLLATWGRGWLTDILKTNWWIGPLALMAVLATAGPFAYIFLEKRAEALLLREQRRYQETLKQAAIGMTRIRHLDKLLNLIVHIVTKTVRISYSAIYLYDTKSEQYLLEAGRNLKNPQATSITKKSSLIVWLQNQRKPLVYEEIKRRAQDNPNLIFKEIEEQMRFLHASVLVPSFLEDKFVGFIILGDKVSGQIYTTDDLNIFSVLASQAALAIENAQFIQEARAMQEQIAQAEKMATIGTMADGLSHQINNRLHALSMIAGDTIDTIKITDTQSLSQEIKEVFTQVSHALQRIQTNVMQGKEIIEGLLKYSRKAETGFSAIGLDEVLDGAIDMVGFKVNLSELDIKRHYPDDLPKIKGSLVQLQEVFFNFIDNAYDAVLERRSLLKEDGYRGRIDIWAQAKDTRLEIIFQDNGIGIREEDAHKVFTPFFTTKISSRRGTGLGLYVIQRIISEFHQGQIRFESNYGKGTRFVIELPLTG